ncbi:DUF2975 domain-containing protein [Rummeliibacillus stabekisii]|uniref:DUF2975 domain-containing protein n=1 Tax=Rummeliibacillus stabekisii TaxID=241244 RepID=UPI0011679555|nr:DUF2975 domain-containing protein [Rummeliibacillus stabekisii]MBB5169740.1 hypothetical protein [Rummeliibacillus stabekisii]GEL03998.1 hypothetical protein RST01_06250 [Rummeliibacillus stabekisii]
MQKINSTILSSVTILIGTIILLLCVFVLPKVAQETVLIHPEVTYLKYPVLLGMYATALPFFYAIYETLIMIQIIEYQSINPSRIVQGLNRIKYSAFVIIVFYVLGIFILDYANALPPIIAVMGFGILLVTIMVAAGASFIKNILIKYQLKLSNS